MPHSIEINANIYEQRDSPILHRQLLGLDGEPVDLTGAIVAGSISTDRKDTAALASITFDNDLPNGIIKGYVQIVDYASIKAGAVVGLAVFDVYIKELGGLKLQSYHGTLTLVDTVTEYEAAPIVLSGDIDVIVGSTYTATGGLEPYSYTMSCGSIDSLTGEVTDLSGCCGSGTVTVTDGFGTVSSLSIRFPIGQWITTGWEQTGVAYFISPNCNIVSPGGITRECGSVVTTSCAGYSSEYVSSAGECSLWYENKPCGGGLYREHRFYCSPIEAWVCI